jgi:glucoamylase
MEALATNTGLLPEQVWDQDDLPDSYMFRGKPTGSATPLAWAHAEYIKLLRSTKDGRVFDRLPEVADRYLSAERQSKPLEIWGFLYPLASMSRGKTLRIVADAPFRLRWSNNDWQTEQDTESISTGIGISFVDLLPGNAEPSSYRFNFYWPQTGNWEGRDFLVALK